MTLSYGDVDSRVRNSCGVIREWGDSDSAEEEEGTGIHPHRMLTRGLLLVPTSTLPTPSLPHSLIVILTPCPSHHLHSRVPQGGRQAACKGQAAGEDADKLWLSEDCGPKMFSGAGDGVQGALGTAPTKSHRRVEKEDRAGCVHAEPLPQNVLGLHFLLDGVQRQEHLLAPRSPPSPCGRCDLVLCSTHAEHGPLWSPASSSMGLKSPTDSAQGNKEEVCSPPSPASLY